MNRWNRFLGIAGIVTLVFGVLCWFLIEHDDYYAVAGHFAAGALLAAAFLAAGGFRSFFSAAGKRVIGFSSGVLFYTLLFAVLLMLINFAAYRIGLFHYDATEQNVFTLAPQTVKVLEGLDKQLTIRAFFLGGVFRNSSEEDLIRRIAGQTSRVDWKMIDPEKEPTQLATFSVLEDATLHFSYGEGSDARTAKVIGRVTEQNVVNAILKITRAGAKKIYYIKGHDQPQLNDDRRQGYLLVREALEGESYIVQELELAASMKVPEDASLIILAAPKTALSDNERSLLGSYVEQGGRALLLHEPRTSDTIRKLAAGFGIAVGADVVLDPSREQAAGASAAQPLIAQYADHPITKGFQGQTMLSIVSSVQRGNAPSKGVEAVEIAYSSEGSWAESNLELIFSDTPSAGYDEEGDIEGPVPVAAAVELAAKPQSGSSDAEAQRKGRVVVFGDADFVTNQYFRQVYNRDLFLNAVNWMVGESGGITIRPRFFRESTERITNAQANVMFLLTGILLPELVLLLGLGVWWSRRV